MKKINKLCSLLTGTKTLVAALGLLSISAVTHATTVQFQTTMGDFEVNLFDKETPETVKNFLQYVRDGAYKDTFMHRSVPNFVLQGGGFTYSGPSEFKAITQKPTVKNEPVLSNVRGTIAMAKLGNNINSATNQWYFNLKNNTPLDSDVGGYTVFGQVTGNGMAIIDAMSKLTHCNKTADKSGCPTSSVFAELPVRDYTSGKVSDKNLALILNIVILDESPNTGDSLKPVRNTSKDNNGGKKSSGGGSTGTTLLLMLAALAGLRFAVRRSR